LCIKAIIFFAYWQGVLIAILSHVGVITPISDFWTVNNIARALQDFAICIEAFILSTFFEYAFGYEMSQPHFDQHEILVTTEIKNHSL
jgi:hypothetical protein